MQHFEGALLIVSHDRTLLDRTAQKMLAIDCQTHKLRAFPGNYSGYVQAAQRECERQAQAFREQQEHIERVRSELRRVKGRAKRIEQRTIHYHYRKRAKKVARSAVVRERRLQRQLASGDKVEKPALTWAMKMDLIDTPVSGKTVVVLEKLGHRFGGQMLFEDVNLRLERGERVAVVGANGSGKTTLLKLIAGELTPSEGGARLGANVRVGYYAQEQEGLNQEATPFEEIRDVSALSETDARSFLHFYLFTGDDAFIPVRELSHGERARLALATLVLGGCNLLLLDEPINHLDIPSRESFERALSAFEGTELLVVHDRHFISHYATGLWSLEGGTIRRYLDLEEKGRVGTAAVV